MPHVRPFEKELHRFFRDEKPEALAEIREKKEIGKELEETVLKAMTQLRDEYVAQHPEAKAA